MSYDKEIKNRLEQLQQQGKKGLLWVFLLRNTAFPASLLADHDSALKNDVQRKRRPLWEV